MKWTICYHDTNCKINFISTCIFQNVLFFVSSLPLWATSADDTLMILFLFFSEIGIWHFKQYVSIGNNVREISKPGFCAKWQKFQYAACWNFSVNNREPDIPCDFPPFCTRQVPFGTFCLSSSTTCSFPKGSKFFSFRVDSFLKKRQNQYKRSYLLENISILKWTWLPNFFGFLIS